MFRAGLVAAAAASLLALAGPVAPSTLAQADSVTAAQPGATAQTVTAAQAQRPNILLIMSDDQTTYDLRFMPRTLRLIGRAGVQVTDFLSPHPLCCPARAEVLTGEYAQNNGVRYNEGPLGGWKAFIQAGNARHQIGLWLHRAGYQTGFVGKMLNKYPDSGKPELPGYDHWNPTTLGTYSYFGTHYVNDGHQRQYPQRYVIDINADYTRSYLKEFASHDQPWFLWVSHVAPHNRRPINNTVTGMPPLAAKRYHGLFNDEVPPSLGKASFNEADVSDKPLQPGRTDPARVTWLFQHRIRALQAVDEANAEAVNQLRRLGELDNTIIAYVSDNGFLLGEHRLLGKNLPYEEALRVPFLMRGPGVPAGKVIDQALNMVDITATFLAAAGILREVDSAEGLDGMNMLPVFRGTATAPDTQLIQGGANGEPLREYGWYWRGVTTRDWTYAHWWDGQEELYDNQTDPQQLDNLAGLPACQALLQQMAERLSQLGSCSGGDCRRSFGDPTDTAPCQVPPAPAPGARQRQQ
ncbi:sulfatase [Nocardioides taihuensis]|uniref:Sulfatase n=1 Tax=Nocardioides taihuensis TaxID=1835606 RepID=A0ABW0BMK6_9ACTN